MIGAAVANLACVPLFVHAFTIASPLVSPCCGSSGVRSSSSSCCPLMRRVVQLRAGPWWHPAIWAVGVVGMNTTFCLALDRIPLAITVAVSFTGPIGLAAWHSRTRRHALGVALVALGVLALVHPGFEAVDPIGLGLAFANAFTWVLYISAVRRLTRRLVAALGPRRRDDPRLAAARPRRGRDRRPSVRPRRRARVARRRRRIQRRPPVLVELFVMRRLTTRAFSVLQALYPAAGVAVGAIGLGQRLRPIELAGIVLVMAASVLALESSAATEPADVAPAT